ncbi:hypothetical protein [Streptomyces sp. NPDC006863]|uniref:hypothetical protein n=1 Tax=Streptomyces sp. NPDC006863 TaxID=3154779 RepID=UPI0033E00E1E
MRKLSSLLNRSASAGAALPGELRARQALDTYRGPYDRRDLFEEYAADFLADLFRVARAEGVDPEVLIERAFHYYVTEPAST